MGDPFLSDPSRKRKRVQKKHEDEEISSDSEEETHEQEEREVSSDEEFQAESAADKRRRLAKQYLANLKETEIGDGDYNAEDLDHDNLSKRLQLDVAENQGNIYKHYGRQIEAQLQGIQPSSVRVGLRNLTGVAVHFPYIYTVSKDMELVKWRADKRKPQRIRHVKGGRRFWELSRNGPNHHCAAINCVAASDDGRFVVTGGCDGRLIIWSTENLACLKVLEVRAPINGVAFRKNSDNLYAACADLKIRTYSINQFAQLEVLYGHQDTIADISALARETCVSVGSRDKTAMFWKIADESRLTFRGGDAEKRRKRESGKGEKENGNGGKERENAKEPFHAEGSMETVAMVDESRFVTGSDNGNLSLWSLWKKKPLFTQRLAHGLEPAEKAENASAEQDASLAAAQIPLPTPYWLTSVYAVPYSDFFLSGLYNGEVKLWQIDESMRSFLPIGSVAVRGCVVKIAGAELKEDKKIVVYVATSKEHRLGRWVRADGRNAVTVLTFDVAL